MKYGLFLAVMLFVALLGGCGSTGGVSAGAETAKGSSRPAMESGDLTLGDAAITTEDGNTLTVSSYESSLSPAGSSKPRPGFEFSAIEVEGCSSPSSGRDLMAVGSAAFVLLMPDGARVLPATNAEETGVREPILQTMDPVPGQCEGGFVVFQTPQGERPEFIVFEEQFKSEDEAPPIRWMVPDE